MARDRATLGISNWLGAFIEENGIIMNSSFAFCGWGEDKKIRDNIVTELMMNNDQRSHFFLPTVNYKIFRICNSYRVWSSSSLSQIKVNPWRLAAAQEELLQNSIKRQKAWRVVFFFFATSQTWQWKDELIVFLVREREREDTQKKKKCWFDANDLRKWLKGFNEFLPQDNQRIKTTFWGGLTFPLGFFNLAFNESKKRIKRGINNGNGSTSRFSFIFLLLLLFFESI